MFTAGLCILILILSCGTSRAACSRILIRIVTSTTMFTTGLANGILILTSRTSMTIVLRICCTISILTSSTLSTFHMIVEISTTGTLHLIFTVGVIACHGVAPITAIPTFFVTRGVMFRPLFTITLPITPPVSDRVKPIVKATLQTFLLSCLVANVILFITVAIAIVSPGCGWFNFILRAHQAAKYG